MDYAIKALKLDKTYLPNYSMVDNTPNRQLSPLGKLNIFVGTNNSGKSRLLRGLIMPEKIFYLPTSIDYESIQEKALEIKNISENLFNSSTIVDITPSGGTPLHQSLSLVNPTSDFGEEPGLINALRDYLMNVKRLVENGAQSVSGRNNAPSGNIEYRDQHQFTRGLTEALYNKHISFIEKLSSLSSEKPDSFDRLYIPIIRGLRPAIDVSGDIYETRTAKDYFSDSNGNRGHNHIKLFCGLNIFSEIRAKLLGSHKDRGFVRKYEDYLSEKFFENKRITLVPSEGRDVLTIKVGKEVEKEIYNVGDGLQTLIIITYPLFVFAHSEKSEEKKLLACIEEPELLVHPGLQRTLISEITSSPLYKNIQFFITTHSNHFLDLTLDYEDISIFRIRKELEDTENDEVVPNFIIENVSAKDKNTLELLGVRNSSVFLSNATIWVEGITDRMYVRHAYGLWQSETKNKGSRKFKEDNHYSFIEYGGANLAHWDFVDKESSEEQIAVENIVSNIFLIADSDDDNVTIKKKSDKKKELSQKEIRLDKIKRKLKSNFYRLEGREIENLISPQIIKKVLERLGVKEKLDSKLSEDDYKNERMGNFLRDKYNLKSIAGDYGEIKNKASFATKVIEETRKMEDLSSEMIKICKKLDSFINKANLV